MSTTKKQICVKCKDGTKCQTTKCSNNAIVECEDCGFEYCEGCAITCTSSCWIEDQVYEIKTGEKSDIRIRVEDHRRKYGY